VIASALHITLRLRAKTSCGAPASLSAATPASSRPGLLASACRLEAGVAAA
jgi:hypothetical protein